MQLGQQRGHALVYAAAAAGLAWLAHATNRWAPEMYMDEPFHVQQTQAYCRGDWHTWDPKITTFPGLYFVGVAWVRALSLLQPWRGTPAPDACTTANLRHVNVLLSVACMMLFQAIASQLAAAAGPGQQPPPRQQQQPRRGAPQPSSPPSPSKQPPPPAGAGGAPASWWQALSAPAAPIELACMLAAYPLHAFFAPLYYTDVGALAALLLCYLLLLRQRSRTAALAAAAAVAFRQTNAVWVAFLLGAALLREASRQPGRIRNQHGAGGGASASGPSLAGELRSALAALWERRAQLAADYGPLAAVPVAFAVFVVLNGGVAVGDRTAHAPVVHAMQLQYCALWVAGAASLLLVGSGQLRRWAQAAAAPGALAALSVAAGVAAASMQRGTLAHPYLLSDNRHYTFYMWRRLLDSSLPWRWCLLPCYTAAWALLGRALLQKQTQLWCAGLALCAAATLVPAGLLELRYFTVPFVLVVLHLPTPPRWAVLATTAAYLALDAATWWVFMRRPFAWGDGSTARFMW